MQSFLRPLGLMSITLLLLTLLSVSGAIPHRRHHGHLHTRLHPDADAPAAAVHAAGRTLLFRSVDGSNKTNPNLFVFPAPDNPRSSADVQASNGAAPLPEVSVVMTSSGGPPSASVVRVVALPAEKTLMRRSEPTIWHGGHDHGHYRGRHHHKHVMHSRHRVYGPHYYATVPLSPSHPTWPSSSATLATSTPAASALKTTGARGDANHGSISTGTVTDAASSHETLKSGPMVTMSLPALDHNSNTATPSPTGMYTNFSVHSREANDGYQGFQMPPEPNSHSVDGAVTMTALSTRPPNAFSTSTFTHQDVASVSTSLSRGDGGHDDGHQAFEAPRFPTSVSAAATTSRLVPGSDAAQDLAGYAGLAFSQKSGSSSAPAPYGVYPSSTVSVASSSTVTTSLSAQGGYPSFEFGQKSVSSSVPFPFGAHSSATVLTASSSTATASLSAQEPTGHSKSASSVSTIGSSVPFLFGVSPAPTVLVASSSSVTTSLATQDLAGYGGFAFGQKTVSSSLTVPVGVHPTTTVSESSLSSATTSLSAQGGYAGFEFGPKSVSTTVSSVTFPVGVHPSSIVSTASSSTVTTSPTAQGQASTQKSASSAAPVPVGIHLFPTVSVLSSSTIINPRPVQSGDGDSVIAPQVLSQKLLGVSANDPTTKYLKVKNPPSLKLPGHLLQPVVNEALSADYGLAADTGVLGVKAKANNVLADLQWTPHLSRDGGKGGSLNGQKLFLFCDTGSYSPPTADKLGDFQGFVSSSVAIDKGNKAAFGQSLVLEDGVGQWSDDAGRLRGLAPMTDGEQSYNQVMAGKGQRYAVWPESSIVPLNQSHAVLYAPIIFDDVNWATHKTNFTYLGSTLLAITADGDLGPRAERVVDRLFDKDEVEWGSIGGFRSYGPAGPGGNDGKVYVIGRADAGLLLGRVDAGQLTDRTAYTFWNGTGWTPDAPSRSSTAYFLPGVYADGDLIYSAVHRTFIFVYLSGYADSTFYYRYLQADEAIRPSALADFGEKLVQHAWSREQVLFKAPPGPTGLYVYAGGVHQGYFDAEDVANGGKQMLLSWTAPTGEDPASMASEYSHVTAVVEFV
ncbi:MAG: hypothetical protein M1826_002362 [Phylliscum demangeonii]|nr:MAG: hypothetical protein M1826_002362 [Phylliscum demangeonii]